MLKGIFKALGFIDEAKAYPLKVIFVCPECGRKEMIGYFERRFNCDKCARKRRKKKQ